MKNKLLLLLSCLVFPLSSCSTMTTDNLLQKRAKKFFKTPIPKSMNYYPNSVSEMIIAQYAETGKADFDEELLELMSILQTETDKDIQYSSVEEQAFMNESETLVREITKQAMQNQKKD